MTHYQKLATMIFRIISVFFLVIGAASAIVSFIMMSAEPRFGIPILIFYVLPTILFSILFSTLSKKFAKWVCFDFDKFNER